MHLSSIYGMLSQCIYSPTISYNKFWHIILSNGENSVSFITVITKCACVVDIMTDHPMYVRVVSISQN